MDPTDGPSCLGSFPETNSSEVLCAATWDTIHCWPPTAPDHAATVPCALILRASLREELREDPRLATARAYRVCDRDGVWVRGNWTNYSECEAVLEALSVSATEHAKVANIVSYVSFAGSIASLAALAVALFIFCYFRSLQCGRLSVHKNLVASFILRFAFMIVIAEASVSERPHNFVSVEWLCKTVVALHLYSVMANVNWMFAEGFYLHSRVAISVFDSGVPFCFFHLIGWALPALYVAVWALATELNTDSFCWIGFSKSRILWILTAPMAIALTVNLGFLLNIVRILVTKLRANNTMETARFRKAVKATAILFPLLGTTNLLFFFNPRQEGDFQSAYFVFNAALQSTQGIFVAVLYCFTNADVASAVRKKYWRIRAKKRMGNGHYYYYDRRVKRSRTSSLALSVSGETSNAINGHRVQSQRSVPGSNSNPRSKL